MPNRLNALSISTTSSQLASLEDFFQHWLVHHECYLDQLFSLSTRAQNTLRGSIEVNDDEEMRSLVERVLAQLSLSFSSHHLSEEQVRRVERLCEEKVWECEREISVKMASIQELCIVELAAKDDLKEVLRPLVLSADLLRMG